MNIIDLSKRAWRTTVDRKPLWLFALLAGGVNATVSVASAREQLPIVWIASGVALASLVAFIVRVIAESALIRGVHQGDVRGLFREAKRFFASVALVHLGGGAALLLLSLAVLSPLLLVPLLHLHVGLAVALTVPLVLVGTPIGLSIAFIYEYALRFVVLEDATATQAWADAKRHLQGRVLQSIQVALVAYVGRSLLQTAFVVLVVPALLAGGLTYAAFGVIPGVVVLAVLAIPVALVAQAAANTFASSVWTHAFLIERG